ncbi:MAG TPA: DNA repair protein RadA [Acidimicrobiales bacterium]|nr:DNA repair protein RadA [Acidimicrobiales bacterium]
MPKLRTVHRCTECGGASPRWSGRCGSCGAWNSLVEEVEEARPAGVASRSGPADRPVPLHEVDLQQWSLRPTGIHELDRVLGGGLVPGSVTLLGGEPGIGKSTLLLQAVSSLAQRGARCLVVSAEESKQQVRVRADRLGVREPTVWLASETSLPHIVAAVGEVVPDVLVVDSVQTIHDPELGSTPGSVVQVRECAQQLVRVAKERGTATVLVGHVTKDGALAGPRALEHVVDTVLSFEGDRHHALRLLRAVKHRFGPTGELGLFEMAETGLVGVPDPSGLLLGDRCVGLDGSAAPGSVVVPAMEGNRPLLVELQALVARTSLPQPRRSAQGLDAGRLALLVAVLERRVGLSLVGADVYASAVGGVRVVEPAADLALGLALASALADVPVPPGVVACGEVGLAGEVRQSAHTPRRLAEAARLGFGRAVVPVSTPDSACPPALEPVRVSTLAQAVTRLGLLPSK